MKNGLFRRLRFNSQLFKDQRKARQQALVNFKAFADDLNKELLEAKNSRKRPATMNKFRKRLELNTKEAIAPYREKEIIEEAFKDIKSFVELEPMFVWTENHVKAHYTICVLSYLVNRTLTLRLRINEGKVSNEIVAHAKFLKETSKCQLDYIEVKNIHQKKINLTKPTSKQRELLKRVSLSNLLNKKIVEKANKNLNYAEEFTS